MKIEDWTEEPYLELTEDIEIIFFDEKYMFSENYFYIFGIIHFQYELSFMTKSNLKMIILFRKDIDIEPFSKYIGD